MTSIATCRLCHEQEIVGNDHKNPIIHYATRSNVHVRCALQRWGKDFFGKLSTDRLKKLPFMILQEFGFLDAAREELARREHSNRQAQNRDSMIGKI